VVSSVGIVVVEDRLDRLRVTGDPFPVAEVDATIVVVGDDVRALDSKGPRTGSMYSPSASSAISADLS
jgi:hypothetical protein